MIPSRKQPFAHWARNAALILLLAMPAHRVAAEPVFSFASTPGKLPKTVVPVHYALDLAPDLEKLTFAGSEVVDIEVTVPTGRLVLNAVDMTIEAATIEGEAASTTSAAACSWSTIRPPTAASG